MYQVKQDTNNITHLISPRTETHNKWLDEAFEVHKGDELVYKKPITVDTMIEYGMMNDITVSGIGYRIEFAGNKMFKPWYVVKLPPGTTESNFECPIPQELLDKEPTLFTRKYTNNPDTTPTIRFYKRIYPDNSQNRRLFAAIKDYFKTIPVTFDLDNLFGSPDTFSPHWNWSGGLQQIYGSETGWEFTIGNGTTPVRPSCIAAFANTNIGSFKFKFNNGQIRNMESMFSSIRTGNWGTFNVTVEHMTPPPSKLIEGTGDGLTKVAGFMPITLIKTFRGCQISQAGLDAIMTNTNWTDCRDFTGAFQDGLRCQHHTVKAAFGCQPFEEKRENTWRPNYHGNATDNNFGLVVQDGRTRYSQGFKETFNAGPIDRVEVICDFDYVFTPSGVNKPAHQLFVNQWTGDEGMKYMKEIRIKNLGNDPLYDFAYGHEHYCQGKFFTPASIKYLIDNVKDLRPYSTDQAVRNRTKVMQPRATLYVPVEWVPHITEEQKRTLALKRWDVFEGTNQLVTADMSMNVSVTYDEEMGSVEVV